MSVAVGEVIITRVAPEWRGKRPRRSFLALYGGCPLATFVRHPKGGNRASDSISGPLHTRRSRSRATVSPDGGRGRIVRSNGNDDKI